MRWLKAAIWRWFKVAIWLFLISVILSAALVFGLVSVASSSVEPPAGVALMILPYSISLFLIGMLIAPMFGFNVKARITPVLTPVVAGTIAELIVVGPVLFVWGVAV